MGQHLLVIHILQCDSYLTLGRKSPPPSGHLSEQQIFTASQSRAPLASAAKGQATTPAGSLLQL